jgi:hypothetical protein
MTSRIIAIIKTETRDSHSHTAGCPVLSELYPAHIVCYMEHNIGVYLIFHFISFQITSIVCT